jgi:hypothetical protein
VRSECFQPFDFCDLDTHEGRPIAPGAESRMLDFYAIPEEDRNWGLLLNPWRPGGGVEPRKRGPPPAARKPAPRQRSVPAGQVPQAPAEPETVVEEGASPLKPRLRRSRGEDSPGTGGASSEAQAAEAAPEAAPAAETVTSEGETPTDGAPEVQKKSQRRKVPAVSFLRLDLRSWNVSLVCFD